ncbi:LGFP repeat-containing protein [Rhodococcus jostii]|uniref:LGFP repeat-containing protein n=1 Tax=Rhodococcus jostii TaxID=132919 RepID=UPI003629BBD5
MDKPNGYRRKAGRPLSVTLLALLLGFGALVGAPSAIAAGDGTYCGHRVLGEIDAKYRSMGDTRSPLGCPTSDELTNPDRYGKQSQFGERGVIHWSGRTGAHPVWGGIRDYWCAFKCEAGKFKYPTSDETQLPNSRGTIYRQNFQCGTIQWQAGWPTWTYICD